MTDKNEMPDEIYVCNVHGTNFWREELYDDQVSDFTKYIRADTRSSLPPIEGLDNALDVYDNDLKNCPSYFRDGYVNTLAKAARAYHAQAVSADDLAKVRDVVNICMNLTTERDVYSDCVNALAIIDKMGGK